MDSAAEWILPATDKETAMTFMKLNRLKLAAFLLALSVSAVTFAQSSSDAPGIVRISDGRSGANIRQPAGIQQASACENGMVGAGTPNAGLGAGNCPPGNGCPTGACQYGRCHQCRGCLLGHCCEHYCKHSPDYGYSPPFKYPLQRRGVEYTNYFPNQWYGAGADYSQARYPMVYQPTDTTQLGYYYQHVPYWQPNPNMLPERPIPAQWHILPPAVSASRFCGPCFPGYYGNHYCNWGNRWAYGPRSYGASGWCPADGSSPTGQPTPAGQPAPAVQPPAGGPGVAPTPIEASLPSPVPFGDGDDDDDAPRANAGVPLQRVPARQDSASSGHIRRIGYNY